MVTSSDCTRVFGDPREVKFEHEYMTVYKPGEYIRNNIPCIPERIYCNRRILDMLDMALRNVVDRGLCDYIQTWDGCFNIRLKRRGDSLSLHSWGVAIDINAKRNPFGKKPTLPPIVVKCFTDVGFEWGGLWAFPDGMHFQIREL